MLSPLNDTNEHQALPLSVHSSKIFGFESRAVSRDAPPCQPSALSEMVVLAATDTGLYYVLSIPGKVTIGRGAANNIQPDNKSVSTEHAAISLINPLVGNKVELWIEDFQSRNGTYMGPSTSELERVNGIKQMKFGDFVKFGNTTKIYRILESPPPVDATARDPEMSLSIPLQGIVLPPESGNGKGMQPQLSQQSLQTSLQTSTDNSRRPSGIENKRPTINQEIPIVPSGSDMIPDYRSDNNIGNMNNMMNNNNNYAQQPNYGYQNNMMAENEPKNMTISINYPTSSLQHPVAITIDPKTNRRSNNNFNPSVQPQQLYSENRRYQDNNYGDSNNIDVNRISSSSNPTNLLMLENNNRQFANRMFDPNLHAINNEYLNSEPPLLEVPNNQKIKLGASRENQEHKSNRESMKSNQYKNDRYDRFNNVGPDDYANMLDALTPSSKDVEFFQQKQGRRNKLCRSSELDPLTLLLRKGNVKMTRFPPAKAQLIHLDRLPSSEQVDWIINKVLGPQLKDDDENKKDEKGSDELPPYVIAEILAEDLLGGDVTVIGQLSVSIKELNKLLKQAHEGMKVVNLDMAIGVSAEFDHVLHDYALSMLRHTVDLLSEIQQSNIVNSLLDADDDGFGCKAGVKIAETAIRLARLHQFLSGELYSDEYEKMSSTDIYEIQAFVFTKALTDVDNAAKTLWDITLKVDAQVGKDGDMDNSDLDLPKFSKSATSKVALSTEIDELRKLKQSVPPPIVVPITISKDTQTEVDKTKRIARFTMILRNHIVFRCINAFFRWKENIRGSDVQLKHEEEISKLRNELHSRDGRIFELESGDLVALLIAERSLNRDLAAMNCELRRSLQELETKLLECASGPVARRKCLVRDVLFGREDELASTRKEVKSLQQELNKLNDIVLEEQKEAQKKATKNKKYELAERSPERMLSKKDKNKRKPPSQLDDNNNMSKEIAKNVILYEVRRMRFAMQELYKERASLGNRLIEETNRNAHLVSSLQVTQRRLNDRERSQNALLILLRQRVGDKGIRELIDGLESMGAGPHALLKDVVPIPMDDLLDNTDADITDGEILNSSLDDEPETSPATKGTPKKSPTGKNAPPSKESQEKRSNYKKAVEEGIFGNEERV